VQCAGVVVWLVLIGITLAGCGGEPDVPGPDGPASTRNPDPVVATDLRAQVQEVVDDLQDALDRGSGWGVCGELADRLEGRLAKGDPVACYTTVDRRVKRMRAAGRSWTKSRVVRVAARGDRAAVTLRDRDGTLHGARLVRQDGQWVLPALDLRTPSGLAQEPAG
jgi:hypothetical protein